MAQKGYSPETRKLLDAMSRRTIAFYPDLAITLDSIPAAIMLGQLLYWHGKQADPDGWIRKSAAEMEQETAISIRQQESARPILISAKAVEYERRGVPPIGHYKINHDNIIELFLRPVQLPQNVVIESPPNVVINSTSHSGDQLPPNVVIDTEITTESTTEITASKQRAAADAAAKAAGIDKMPSARVAKAKAKKVEANSQYDLGELEDAPAIRVHRQVCGEQLITIEQAKRIISQVNGTAETTWRDRLRFWMGKGWRADTIDKHILYNETENKREEARMPKPTASGFTPEQYAELAAKMERPWT